LRKILRFYDLDEILLAQEQWIFIYPLALRWWRIECSSLIHHMRWIINQLWISPSHQRSRLIFYKFPSIESNGRNKNRNQKFMLRGRYTFRSW
jgi:hypothetical protein